MVDCNIIFLINKLFDLFWILVNYLNCVFLKIEFYECVWGEEFLDDINILNVYIYVLCNDFVKFSIDNILIIKIVWGLGYKLEE